MEGIEFTKILMSNGWPTALVIVGGVALYRFAKWAKPLLERAAAVHIETVEKVGDCQKEISATNARMEARQGQLNDLVAAALNNPKMTEVHGHVEHIRKKIDRQWPDNMT